MDLECVIQSTVSEREKQIPCANTYIWNLKKKKKVHEEPRGRTEIKMQTYWGMDLRIGGGERYAETK